ncbi:MAG: AAA family ATPase [Deltaproteobacteria bacterium CG_4_8_14_3_um_filter_45_9]|nr:MAG: AAA family ATPase [Deltaproteobacteria bacterium CG03_land_8_20_14_0_80_45_14]PIX25016.1 MAG: AAA family ATPase [Deltaproteobacteria bacterium CG_4_8_14_3_um_filter_45_9]
MEPWYKIATPRKEVREGRSFNPDEFAIALEQVIAGTAPEDYREPKLFFSRTCFTRALNEHIGMVLRRLAGKTENTAPILALITQFGGGKTHTLTALYHLIQNRDKARKIEELNKLLQETGLPEIPIARVAVFVGNAWDPSAGAETPWIDIARQLAGDDGITALGPEAKTKAPGTNNLRKLIDTAGGHILILCDEVLNFLSRHRDKAESFRDFLANLVRTLTGTTGSAAMISLPQSKPEMSDWDLRWQDIVVKEVNRVAKNLISNDEAEISEVVRRRLFEDLGNERTRKNVAKTFADWCFERRAQLPPEWTAVDTATTEAKAREYLQKRFEACYPFHPSTLSVFQRKWQVLPQYQQTRGTLAMLAQWISIAYPEGYKKARREPLITLGSAPMDVPAFRGVVLSQLGEPRLVPAIDADISGPQSHARALDADTKGPLRDIHCRVATTILFESSGGQVEKLAHLPELRFALGEPELDTTSIDNAAYALESKAFFISRVGSDGFRIYHKATIRKAVNDRRASLDEDAEIKPTMWSLVKKEFERGASVILVPFPKDGSTIQDSPKLTLVLMDPEMEWSGEGNVRQQIAEWTKQHGKSPRLYPGSLIWCLKKPGRDLRDKVELWLAWKRVFSEVTEGTLGADFDRADRADIQSKVKDAEDDAKDEVWGGYRFAVIFDSRAADGLKPIDLGAGHASSGETLCGRVITALKSQALLNESVGAGYIERNWPPALKESGAWPLASLRQSFLNGALTRLLDPDTTLRNKIVEFVGKGDLGLASGQKPDGTYERTWFEEPISLDEITFDAGVFLLTKAKAKTLKAAGKGESVAVVSPVTQPASEGIKEPEKAQAPSPGIQTRTLRLVGTVPPEIWNRLGTKIIPKLKSGSDLKIGVDFSVTINTESARSVEAELRQILEDLGLKDKITIEELG